MKTLIIYDAQNSRFKRDGDEFKRQAEKCAQWYDEKASDILSIEIEGKNRIAKRLNLHSAMSSVAKRHQHEFDRVIFFCHGHPKALNRGMISMKKDGGFEPFCDTLKLLVTPAAAIIFYSCKTGALANGFAHQVAVNVGVEVIGHKTSGHTVWNPYKRIFMPEMQHLYPANRDEFRPHVKEMKDSRYAFQFVEDALIDDYAPSIIRRMQ